MYRNMRTLHGLLLGGHSMILGWSGVAVEIDESLFHH